LAIKRLQDDGPHPGREPHQGLIVPDRAVTARVGQCLRIDDGPPLEEQVSGRLFDERRRTVVAVRAGIDCQEL
jgi:hypothetical protein